MKRLSAVVGEYTDKQTNQQKAEWASVGVIGVSAKGKEYMLLNPEVSLAYLLSRMYWPRTRVKSSVIWL